MIPDLSYFNFDRMSWLYLLIAALMSVREKRILPYLAAVSGAFVQGWVGLFLLVAITWVERVSTGKSKWLLWTQSVGFTSMLVAWHASEPLQGYYLLFGVLLCSFQFRAGSMGVMVPLLLAHARFPEFESHPWVLVAAGLYLLLEEVLRLAKVKWVETAMRLAEFPVVLVVLAPFWADVAQLPAEPEVLAPFASLLGVVFVLAVVLWIKNVPFRGLVSAVNSRGAKIYKKLHRGFSERRSWMREGEWVATPGDKTQIITFWSVLIFAGIWAVLAVLYGEVLT